MLQPAITSVKPLKGCKLLLSFATGERKEFDVTPYATGDWYGELRDPSYFASVRVLPDGSGIAWRDGQDIAPRELYELSNPVSA